MSVFPGPRKVWKEQTIDCAALPDARPDAEVPNPLEIGGVKFVAEGAVVNPEAVVFIIGANDASIVNNGDRNADGIPDWELDYRVKVARMMDTFIGGDAHRTGVLDRHADDEGMTSLNRGAVELNRVIRRGGRQASRRRASTSMRTSSSGAERRLHRSATKTSPATRCRARIPDGVHFSTDGAQAPRRLAVYKLIEKQWNSIEQADPAQPI